MADPLEKALRYDLGDDTPTVRGLYKPPVYSPQMKALMGEQDTADDLKVAEALWLNDNRGQGRGVIGALTKRKILKNKEEDIAKIYLPKAVGMNARQRQIAQAKADAAGQQGYNKTAFTKALEAQNQTTNREDTQQFQIDQYNTERGHELEDAAGATILEDSRLRDINQREDEERVIKQFHDPTDPAQALNLWEYRDRFTTMGGDEVSPEMLTKLKVWKDPSTGSVPRPPSAASDKLGQENIEANAGTTAMLNTFSRIMTSPKNEFLSATGPVDWERYYAPLAGENDPYMEQVAGLQTAMDSLSFKSVIPALKELAGSTSDKDMKKVFEGSPDKDSEPTAWAIWAEDRFIPELIGMATAAGIKTPEQIRAIETQLRDDVATFKRTHAKGDERKNNRAVKEKRIEEIKRLLEQ